MPQDTDPLEDEWTKKLIAAVLDGDLAAPGLARRFMRQCIATVRADERGKAVRLCEQVAAYYDEQGPQVGWKLNATGALRARDAVAAGRFQREPAASRSPDMAEDIAAGRVQWTPKCSVCGSDKVVAVEGRSNAEGRHQGDHSCADHMTDNSIVIVETPK